MQKKNWLFLIGFKSLQFAWFVLIHKQSTLIDICGVVKQESINLFFLNKFVGSASPIQWHEIGTNPMRKHLVRCQSGENCLQYLHPWCNFWIFNAKNLFFICQKPFLVGISFFLNSKLKHKNKKVLYDLDFLSRTTDDYDYVVK